MVKMSRQQFDTFLPSGSVEERSAIFHHQSEPMLSPKGLDPRGVPGYIPTPYQQTVDYMNCRPASNPNTNYSITPTQTFNGALISPPISRTCSSDSNTELVQDWRAYTRKLREQFAKEREHMATDRVLSDEIMAEERALWDRERDVYERRIAELESKLSVLSNPTSPDTNNKNASASKTGSRDQSPSQRPPFRRAYTNLSNGSSNDSFKGVPQESGRNPDGSPFYAPSSRNPSRTFGSVAEEVGIDDLPGALEIPITVTSHQLTQSDFGLHSPDSRKGSREGSIIGDSIDISLIQPGLEGVPIKNTAVSPMFAAKNFSPSGSTMSPSKFSPSTVPPPRPRGQQTSPPRKSCAELIKAPEDRRLTMHAGHTPSHSVTKFDLESGNATPTQLQPNPVHPPDVVEPLELNASNPEDPALTGPLGLTNDVPGDGIFLATLTSKLEEVIETMPQSDTDSEISGPVISDHLMLKTALVAIGRKSSIDSPVDDENEGPTRQADDIPILRLKPSTNFGRPLGSL
jgi:hypothetical protein